MRTRLLTALGYLIPVIPLARCLRDVNRRFYTFIEQPLIGILVTPLSLIFANTATNTPYAFDGAFVQACIEVYFAYNVASIVRDGVNTEPQIPARVKVFLNWFYSAASYVFFTAGAKLARAQTPQEYALALKLVAFSLAWPVFSQAVSTYVWTPLMFARFPKRTLLTSLFDMRVSTEQVLASASGPWDARWVQWYRVRHYWPRPAYQQVEYWLIKTTCACVVAILMTTLYFIARWNLV